MAANLGMYSETDTCNDQNNKVKKEHCIQIELSLSSIEEDRSKL